MYLCIIAKIEDIATSSSDDADTEGTWRLKNDAGISPLVWECCGVHASSNA